MLFNSGFVANQAILKHLPGKNDFILADRLIHHSLAQALIQCPAKFKRYDHLNLDSLEVLLKSIHENTILFLWLQKAYSAWMVIILI